MKKKNVGEGTFNTVRGRYRDWFGAGHPGTLPGRTVVDEDYEYAHTRPAGGGEDMNRMVLMGIGGGIGLVLLALAVLSFMNAAEWSEIARDGAAVGYTLVGVFLTIAGLGSIFATWNHHFGAGGRPAGHH